jgi:hypothetical protein
MLCAYCRNGNILTPKITEIVQPRHKSVLERFRRKKKEYAHSKYFHHNDANQSGKHPKTVKKSDPCFSLSLFLKKPRTPRYAHLAVFLLGLLEPYQRFHPLPGPSHVASSLLTKNSSRRTKKWRYRRREAPKAAAAFAKNKTRDDRSSCYGSRERERESECDKDGCARAALRSGRPR